MDDPYERAGRNRRRLLLARRQQAGTSPVGQRLRSHGSPRPPPASSQVNGGPRPSVSDARAAGPARAQSPWWRSQPPATAGMMETVSPSATSVSSPSRNRTSSSATYRFTKRRRPPSSSSRRSLKPGVGGLERCRAPRPRCALQLHLRLATGEGAQGGGDSDGHGHRGIHQRCPHPNRAASAPGGPSARRWHRRPAARPSEGGTGARLPVRPKVAPAPGWGKLGG
jgi:hypothetical protein